MEYSVIIVHSTGHAIRLERLLQGQGIACKMIPVPRQISSNCGVCVRVLRAEVEAASQVIAAAQLEIEGIYEM
jgi:hypothetical protein